MGVKTLMTKFLLFGMCLALFWQSGCQKTKISHANKTSISNGQFTAQINDLKLWYKVSGKGPVCILPTPGWGPSSELYFLDMAPMEEMFTMVYLDTRGSGRSQRPELNQYNMTDFVADLEGLRHHLGLKKVWLMGHSNGGTIVLNYAVTYPDRVLGLILVDTIVGNASADPDMPKRMQLRKDEPWFAAALKQWKKQPQTPEEFNAYIKGITPFYFYSVENLEKHQEVFERTTMSFDALQGQVYSESASKDLASRLSEIEIPTLIIVGVDDFLCGLSAAQPIHREIPGSKLLVIGKAGHFPWLEQPEKFFGGIRNFLPKLGYDIN
jgi:proline iminopeptidase